LPYFFTPVSASVRVGHLHPIVLAEGEAHFLARVALLRAVGQLAVRAAVLFATHSR
jgi:hypothetical protein